MTNYPLASTSWDEKEIAAIQRVIASGNYTMGKEVATFEQDFAKYTGSKFCVMVNSGSSANLLAIAALMYRKKNHFNIGDEVIVPAISWPTTFYPLYQYGLKLKFIDIDLETLNFDLNALKGAITEKTKAIFAVNLLGNSNDFGKIREIIGNRNIVLIEDNCESMGAVLSGKQTGTFGVMGTYSAFFSHHISTMEGGMIVTDDEELYHILLSLRAHGWTRNLPKNNLVTGTKSDEPFEESFRFVLPGYNVRPIEMSGAIGQDQIKKLPDFIKKRRENAFYFQELFQNHPYLTIQKEVGESSWFGFSFVIKEGSGIKRKDLVKKLEAAKVECRPIVAGNFAKNEVVKYFNYEIHGKLKNAQWIDQNGLFVGNHHYDIRSLIKRLREVLN